MNLQTRTWKKISVGAGERLGTTLAHDGTNFAIYSQYATEVFLLLFDSPSASEPTDIIKVENKTPEHVWHVFVHDVRPGQLYGYKINGPYEPKEGMRFNPNKLLIDPYAKALSGVHQYTDGLLFGYQVLSEGKDLEIDTRDSSGITPKCIVVDDAFDWQGDQSPHIPKEELIIYEVHLKGFTAHPSSGVQKPGTYLGFIEKINYLKSLGVNAVEFLPLQEFFVQDYVAEKGLTNYWGYDTIGFFAPTVRYSSQSYLGCQVHEFKTLIKELHKAGIKVILDVVYNHTAEGNHLGPTLSFKGIDNPTYYYLVQNPDAIDEPYRYYRNDTGCGNTFNAEHPMALRLILDSLRYWVQEMHIDGFRFDLAPVLGRSSGEFNKESGFFKAIAEDPVLNKVIMIAEPWDLTTYQVGGYPPGWMEWNGQFRDTARQYLKGDDGKAGDFAKRLTASRDIYEPQGRPIHESINFITCHDGFTLYDLYAYNEKHNEANLENNADGSNDNHSWNCGYEGDMDNPVIEAMRKQMVKNALCTLFLSWGTPMLLYGDEVMRTQRGNNNGWCQDNDITWMNWELCNQNKDILEFCIKLIAWRKQHIKMNNVPVIEWFDRRLETPTWDNPRLKVIGLCRDDIYCVFNANYRGSEVAIPLSNGKKWFRIIDTGKIYGRDFYSVNSDKGALKSDHYRSAPHTVLTFIRKNP